MAGTAHPGGDGDRVGESAPRAAPPPLQRQLARPPPAPSRPGPRPSRPDPLSPLRPQSHGGDHVEVEGSFDNWTSRTALQRSGRDFTIVKLLPPGVYQYKFIVDGVWRYAPDQQAMYDEMGNINNVMEVHEFIPENLDGLEGFEPPLSPAESYNRPAPTQEDFAKDAPQMPPHLHLTLLNVPPALDPTTSLPRPQHVILQHLYTMRHAMGSMHNRALLLGLTRRYRSKYVTTIMYKPGGRKTDAAGAHPPGGQPPRPAASDVSMHQG